MSDLLTQSVNSMNVYRRALEVTANNVANVNTEGYSRTRITVVESPPEFNGQNAVGQGARAVDVTRGYHNFVNEQLQKATTYLSRYKAIDELSTQFERLFPNGESLLEAGFDHYFNAWQSLANDPTSTEVKSHLLQSQQVLTDRMAILNQTFKTLNAEVNGKITKTVDTINQLAQQLVENNMKLGRTGKESSQARHDLLDKRDQLMKELNQLVDAKLFERGNGIIEVYINDTKTPLINDNRAIRLEALPSAFAKGDKGLAKSEQLDVMIQQPGTGVMTSVGDLAVGGELAGLLAFRRSMLDRAQDELGLASTGLMIASNILHRQGVDTFGQTGGDLFSANGASDADFYTAFKQIAYHHEQNKGDAVLSVNLYGANFDASQTYATNYKVNPDLSALRPRSYLVVHDPDHPSGFRVSDQRTGEHIDVLSGNGTAQSPLQFEGLEVVVSKGTVRATDQFEIRFYRDAMNQAKVMIHDSQAFAYRAQGAGIANNDIALNMAGLDAKAFLLDQEESPRSLSRQTALHLGQFHQTNRYALEAQTLLAQQIQKDRDAAAGVSLDEEAQNMIQYQAMYHASAKVMQASRQLFALLRSVM